jgi:hypothetical protein
MLLRRRLNKIEKDAGVFGCPHCKWPLARVQPVMTTEDRAEWLVELCKSVLAERPGLGDANTRPPPAEAIRCPSCGKQLPPQAVGRMVAPVEEVVAALIEAERRPQEPAP